MERYGLKLTLAAAALALVGACAEKPADKGVEAAAEAMRGDTKAKIAYCAKVGGLVVEHVRAEEMSFGLRIESYAGRVYDVAKEECLRSMGVAPSEVRMGGGTSSSGDRVVEDSKAGAVSGGRELKWWSDSLTAEM